jgi:PhnB protein
MAKRTAKRGRRTAGRSSARARGRARRPARVPPVPPLYGSVTPHLVARDCARALEWYARALGARELMRMPGPEGKIMHAEVKIGDSVVMLSDEFPEQGARSPQTLGGCHGGVMLYVRDVDDTYRRTIDAGARSLMEPQDMFWGDRYSKIEDPFGHYWGIATAKEKVSPKESARRLAAMAAKQQPPQAPPAQG